MKLESTHKRFIDELLEKDMADVVVGGFAVSVRMLDNGSSIALKTVVYSGDNYIPPSVRSGIHAHPPFSYGAISAKLILSEESFQVHLHYHTEIETVESQKFFNLLDEYGWLANQWRDFFDEQDRNDLVHTPVK